MDVVEGRWPQMGGWFGNKANGSGPAPAAEEPAYVYNDEVKAWIPRGMTVQAFLAEEAERLLQAVRDKERQRRLEQARQDRAGTPSTGCTPSTTSES